MPAARLNLLVLRSPDMERLERFYSKLGINFVKHRHGSGPEHFSGQAGDVVLEIYPADENSAATSESRIGFGVTDLPKTIVDLQSAGAEIQSPSKMSPWGLRAVVRDLDGRRVELTEIVPT